MAGPISNDKCPCKRREEEKTRHRGEGHVREAEIRAILPQGNRPLESPGAGSGMERILLQSLEKEPVVPAR